MLRFVDFAHLQSHLCSRLILAVGIACGQLGATSLAMAQANVPLHPRGQVKSLSDDAFSAQACIAGKVFVDCNHNHVQDAQELGIPGVRLYLQDGTYFITDTEGKYSLCGLPAKSHVITIDRTTLPRSARLATTSSRNGDDAYSLYLDAQSGQLLRADFAESSCSSEVMAQIKSRQSALEPRSTNSAKAKPPALKWDSAAPQTAQGRSVVKAP
jgi:large repetitive protein